MLLSPEGAEINFKHINDVDRNPTQILCYIQTDYFSPETLEIVIIILFTNIKGADSLATPNLHYEFLHQCKNVFLYSLYSH